jgi:hypothetical protein
MSMEEVELDGLAAREPQVFGSASADSEGLRRRAVNNSEKYDEYEGVKQVAMSDGERSWSLATAVVCGMDLVASTTIMAVAFKYAYRDNGVSLYCMGFQALSHELSSLLLLVRLAQELLFYKSREGSEASLLRENRRRSLHREQALSIMMGIVMLISSVSLLFKAFRKLRFWDKWYKDHQNMDREAAEATDWLAWWGFFIYTAQALFRFFAGRRLRQSLVWHCFIASVVSLLYLLVLGIAALEEKEWSWKAEPIAAIALAFVTLVEGIRIVYYYFDDMDTRLQYDERA